MGVVVIRRLSGSCREGAIIRSLSFTIPRKGIFTLLNDGNTKGDAAVGVVLKLIGGRTKAIAIPARAAVNCSPRAPCFPPFLATVRILICCTGLRGLPRGAVRRRTRGLLTYIKLRGDRAGVHRCSGNVLRQLTLTRTLLKGPRVLVLSRPYTKLSTVKQIRVLRLVHHLGRSKGAVLVGSRVLDSVRHI